MAVVSCAMSPSMGWFGPKLGHPAQIFEGSRTPIPHKLPMQVEEANSRRAGFHVQSVCVCLPSGPLADALELAP